MLRSLYSGISGMKINQIKLDIIGSNIANSSTTGYKCKSVHFSDAVSQSMEEASSPSSTLGGINPQQVSLGAGVSGITTMMNQGNMQSSSSLYDMAVDGDGYFIVAKGPTAFSDADGVKVTDPAAADKTSHKLSTATGANKKNLSVSYTRDGSFTTDEDGNLVTADGYRILGYSITDGTTSSIADDGTINYVNADSVDAATGLSNLKTVKNGTTAGSDDILKTLRIPDSVKASDGTYKKIISFSVESNGLIKAKLEGGGTAALGQVALASFKNPQGLKDEGGNRLTESADSGTATIRAGIGEASATDNSQGYGDVKQNYTEMSNVDLAEQFTDMIVASRAFEANSKMISTGDEILQTIVNLKR